MKKRKTYQPETNTLYEKRGNKYVPIAEHCTMDYLAKGCYMVIVRPGWSSRWSRIWPERPASVEAAVKIMGDAMCTAMLDKMDDGTTDSRGRVCRHSIYDVVQAGLSELVKYFKDEQ